MRALAVQQVRSIAEADINVHQEQTRREFEEFKHSREAQDPQ
jgi:hypothetical protein